LASSSARRALFAPLGLGVVAGSPPEPGIEEISSSAIVAEQRAST
jgi:hypothetical protein